MSQPYPTIEQEAAALTPRHAAPEIVDEIRRAVREARGLPAEATILKLPTQTQKDRLK